MSWKELLVQKYHEEEHRWSITCMHGAWKTMQHNPGFLHGSPCYIIISMVEDEKRPSL